MKLRHNSVDNVTRQSQQVAESQTSTASSTNTESKDFTLIWKIAVATSFVLIIILFLLNFNNRKKIAYASGYVDDISDTVSQQAYDSITEAMGNSLLKELMNEYLNDKQLQEMIAGAVGDVITKDETGAVADKIREAILNALKLEMSGLSTKDQTLIKDYINQILGDELSRVDISKLSVEDLDALVKEITNKIYDSDEFLQMLENMQIGIDQLDIAGLLDRLDIPSLIADILSGNERLSASQQAALDAALTKKLHELISKDLQTIIDERLAGLKGADGADGKDGADGTPTLSDEERDKLNELIKIIQDKYSELIKAIASGDPDAIKNAIKELEDALLNLKNGLDGVDGADSIIKWIDEIIRELHEDNPNLDKIRDLIESIINGIIGGNGSDGSNGNNGSEGGNGNSGSNGSNGSNGTDGSNGTNGSGISREELEKLMESVRDAYKELLKELVNGDADAIEAARKALEEALKNLKDGIDGINGSNSIVEWIDKILQEITSGDLTEEKLRELFKELEDRWSEFIKNINNSSNGSDGSNGSNGADGKDGVDGYTPVKGVDYFTSEELQQLIEQCTKETSNTLINDLTEIQNSISNLQNDITNLTEQSGSIEEYIKNLENNQNLTQETIETIANQIAQFNNTVNEILATSADIYQKIDVTNMTINKVTNNNGSVDTDGSTDTTNISIAEFVEILANNQNEYTKAINNVYETLQNFLHDQNIQNEYFNSLIETLQQTTERHDEAITNIYNQITTEDSKDLTDSRDLANELAKLKNEIYDALAALKKAIDERDGEATLEAKNILNEYLQKLETIINGDTSYVDASTREELRQLQELINNIMNLTDTDDVTVIMNNYQEIHNYVTNLGDSIDETLAVLNKHIQELEDRVVTIGENVDILNQQVMDIYKQLQTVNISQKVDAEVTLKDIEDLRKQISEILKKITNAEAAGDTTELERLKSELYQKFEELYKLLSDSKQFADADMLQNINNMMDYINNMLLQLGDSANVTDLDMEVIKHIFNIISNKIDELQEPATSDILLYRNEVKELLVQLEQARNDADIEKVIELRDTINEKLQTLHDLVTEKSKEEGISDKDLKRLYDIKSYIQKLLKELGVGGSIFGDNYTSGSEIDYEYLNKIYQEIRDLMNNVTGDYREVIMNFQTEIDNLFQQLKDAEDKGDNAAVDILRQEIYKKLEELKATSDIIVVETNDEDLIRMMEQMSKYIKEIWDAIDSIEGSGTHSAPTVNLRVLLQWFNSLVDKTETLDPDPAYDDLRELEEKLRELISKYETACNNKDSHLMETLEKEIYDRFQQLFSEIVIDKETVGGDTWAVLNQMQTYVDSLIKVLVKGGVGNGEYDDTEIRDWISRLEEELHRAEAGREPGEDIVTKLNELEEVVKKLIEATDSANMDDMDRFKKELYELLREYMVTTGKEQDSQEGLSMEDVQKIIEEYLRKLDGELSGITGGNGSSVTNVVDIKKIKEYFQTIINQSGDAGISYEDIERLIQDAISKLENEINNGNFEGITDWQETLYKYLQELFADYTNGKDGADANTDALLNELQKYINDMLKELINAGTGSGQYDDSFLRQLIEQIKAGLDSLIPPANESVTNVFTEIQTIVNKIEDASANGDFKEVEKLKSELYQKLRELLSELLKEFENYGSDTSELRELVEKLLMILDSSLGGNTPSGDNVQQVIINNYFNIDDLKHLVENLIKESTHVDNSLAEEIKVLQDKLKELTDRLEQAINDGDDDLAESIRRDIYTILQELYGDYQNGKDGLDAVDILYSEFERLLEKYKELSETGDRTDTILTEINNNLQNFYDNLDGVSRTELEKWKKEIEALLKGYGEAAGKGDTDALDQLREKIEEHIRELFDSYAKDKGDTTEVYNNLINYVNKMIENIVNAGTGQGEYEALDLDEILQRIEDLINSMSPAASSTITNLYTEVTNIAQQLKDAEAAGDTEAVERLKKELYDKLRELLKEILKESMLNGNDTDDLRQLLEELLRAIDASLNGGKGVTIIIKGDDNVENVQNIWLSVNANLKDLENDLRDLIAKLEHTTMTLGQNIDKLNSQVADIYNRIDQQTQKEAKDKKEILDALDSNSNLVDKALEQLEEAIAAGDEEAIEAAQKRLGKELDLLAQATENMTEDKLGELDAETQLKITEMKEYITNVIDKVSNGDYDIADIRDNVTVINNNVTEVRDTLSQRLDELDKRVMTIGENVDYINKLLEQQTNLRLDEQNQLRDELNKKQEILDQKLAVLQDAVNDGSTDLIEAARRDLLDALEDTNSSIQSEIDSLGAEAAQNVITLQNYVTTLAEQLKSNNFDFTNIQNDVTGFKTELAAVDAKITTNMVNIQSQLTTTGQNIDQLNRDLLAKEDALYVALMNYYNKSETHLEETRDQLRLALKDVDKILTDRITHKTDALNTRIAKEVKRLNTNLSSSNKANKDTINNLVALLANDMTRIVSATANADTYMFNQTVNITGNAAQKTFTISNVNITASSEVEVFFPEKWREEDLRCDWSQANGTVTGKFGPDFASLVPSGPTVLPLVHITNKVAYDNRDNAANRTLTQADVDMWVNIDDPNQFTVIDPTLLDDVKQNNDLYQNVTNDAEWSTHVDEDDTVPGNKDGSDLGNGTNRPYWYNN